jgi:hypothetical protein
MKIKRDLSHNPTQNYVLVSPFSATDPRILLQEIILKIQELGKKKLTRIDRLEAVYYLGKLIEENQNQQYIIQDIKQILREKFKRAKAYRLEKQAKRTYAVF